MARSAHASYALGIDFGTASVRAVVFDTSSGAEVGAAEAAYASGKAGVLSDPKQPHLARQNPADYFKALEAAVPRALSAAKSKRKRFRPEQIVGIGVDATGSTPVPVDARARPLDMARGRKTNLNAQAWLWKDHTAHEEAAEITQKARDSRDEYLRKCGGAYSSEWFWAKLLHCKRTDAKTFAAAHTWVEQSDLIPAYLTGVSDADAIVRNICAAGHKGLYHEQWGGWPRRGFLASLAPELATLAERLPPRAVPANQPAGTLDAAVAQTLGLPAGIAVATGIIDAHAGAVGAGIRPGTLVKIIGTSTCDMMVVPLEKDLVDIPGLCGIARESILPGHFGLEAGQSAVGDLFDWFANNLAPREFVAKGQTHQRLSEAAARLEPGASGLLALDWNNGNRTVLVDPLLSGLLIGQTLHTTAPQIYRALIEATAFGALTVIKRFGQYGVKVSDVVNCGGIAEKNPLLMQIYADVINKPMKLSHSAQTCALGAAIYGAVVGGAHPDVAHAQQAMTRTQEKVYKPRKAAHEIYARLYRMYMLLHDAFGTEQFKGELNRVMKDLIDLRHAARNH